MSRYGGIPPAAWSDMCPMSGHVFEILSTPPTTLVWCTWCSGTCWYKVQVLVVRAVLQIAIYLWAYACHWVNMTGALALHEQLMAVMKGCPRGHCLFLCCTCFLALQLFGDAQAKQESSWDARHFAYWRVKTKTKTCCDNNSDFSIATLHIVGHQTVLALMNLIAPGNAPHQSQGYFWENLY